MVLCAVRGLPQESLLDAKCAPWVPELREYLKDIVLIVNINYDFVAHSTHSFLRNVYGRFFFDVVFVGPNDIPSIPVEGPCCCAPNLALGKGCPNIMAFGKGCPSMMALPLWHKRGPTWCMFSLVVFVSDGMQGSPGQLILRLSGGKMTRL